MDSKKVKEIKTALEYCGYGNGLTCKKCLYIEDGCNIALTQDALTLINELESENKSLQDLCNKTYEDLTKEIDRLEKENETKTGTITDLLKNQEFYEKEKLKQFTEMLKEKNVDYYTKGIIDETLKECTNERQKDN